MQNTATAQAARQPLRVLIILSALMGFGSISTDLYLPAMPEMGSALGADAGRIELTVTGFLIGFSLGQLFWGRSAIATVAGFPSQSGWCCSSSAQPVARPLVVPMR